MPRDIRSTERHIAHLPFAPKILDRTAYWQNFRISEEAEPAPNDLSSAHTMHGVPLPMFNLGNNSCPLDWFNTAYEMVIEKIA
jgi:hypothetical protein